MDLTAYFQFLIALAIVLALIAVCAWVARRVGRGGGLAPRRGQPRRLSVVEAAVVDGKRRLVLVKCDEAEHLVLTGGATDVVIERNLRPPPAAKASGGAEAAE